MATTTTTTRPGSRNDITDVGGFTVGHHQRRGTGWRTGTTVVLPPALTVGAADVRGGGPATRETDALGPTTMVERVDAVCFTGGSAYGLAAAGGVMAWLEEQGRGFPVGPAAHQVVPIVATAAVFDLGRGGRFANRPDAAFGYQAARRSRPGAVRQGSVGAGTGAEAGSLAGGVGSASAVTVDGVTVGALVVVNSAGSVIDPTDGVLWGARHGIGGEFDLLRAPSRSELRAFAGSDERPWPFNTTLVVVATDARLSKPECHRMAGAGHDGMARAITPVHGYTDGDIVIGLATGAAKLMVEEPDDAGGSEGPAPAPAPTPARFASLDRLFAVAADVVTRAIVHAVLNASTSGATAAYGDHFPSAVRARQERGLPPRGAAL